MPPATPLAELESILASDDAVAIRAARIVALAPKLPDEAIDVLDAALADADPLLQVAIMDAYFTMTEDAYHEQDLEALVRKAARMGDEGEQLYMAARLALGRVNGLSMDRLDGWGDGQIEITATRGVRGRAGGARRGRGRAARAEVLNEITIIIHGTWAADGVWWRPGGDFFEYTRTELQRADLYDKSDQFKWSGKNRDSKRRQAATALHSWLKSHPSREVNVFAHSHGANVAMLATHEDVRIDRLVMLSPPVRSDYFAKWSNVGKAYNIQASHDPVVAIAKGGQWFRLPEVREKELEASGHSASHDPAVWRAERLADFISIPW